MRSLLPIALAACGSAGPQPAPLAHQAPEAGCLPSRVSDDSIAELRSSDGRATLCFQDGTEETDRTCVRIDREGRVAGAAKWEERSPGKVEHTLEPAGQGYTVCARSTGTCATFRVGHRMNEALETHGTLSNDGSLAFVLYTRSPPNRAATGRDDIIGELYEVRTGRLLASANVTSTIGFWDTITHAQQIVGSYIFLAEYPAGPGGDTGIMDLASGKGMVLRGYGGDQIFLDPRTLLVLDRHELSIADLTAMKKVQQLAVPGREFDHAELISTSMTRLGAVVLVAYAQPPGVAVFDIATRRLSAPRPLPICPE